MSVHWFKCNVSVIYIRY